MLINSLFLPLTGLTTIKALLAAAADKENAVRLPVYFAEKLLSTYSYFITYFI